MTSASSSFFSDAASWWNQGDDEVDKEDPYKGSDNEKDCTIFVIDCNEKMFDEMKLNNNNTENKMDIDDNDDENENNKSIFANVCKAIENTLKRKIIKSKDDSICFVLFNTLESQNGLNLSSVYLLSVPDSPSAKIIREIRDLPLTFKNKFNALKNNKQCDFRDVLWVIQGIFSESDLKGVKYGSKRAFIFTNNDTPNYQDEKATVSRAQDMLNNGIEISVFPLVEKFEIKKFYGNICTFNLDELSTETHFRELCPTLEDLENDLRVKEMKKRTLASCPLTIGPNFKMVVNMYSLYRRAKKESPQWLDARTNQPLTTQTRWICADTGQILDTDTQVKTYHEYGPMKDKIYFTKEEMKDMKTFGTPCMTVMGFKPLGRLKPYYQYRTSAFLYPNEERCIGSTIAFNSLIEAMDRLQQYAVCRVVLRKQSPPRFVALIAQREVIDKKTNKQTQAPGMNMIYLPYADDIRKIDIEGQEDMKKCDEKEDEIFIEKAKQIIDKLLLDDMYIPSNPVLQKHYDALEALALEQLNINDNNDSDNEDDNFIDEIQPADEQMIDAANNEINEFLKVIQDRCGAQEEVNTSKKRGRASGGAGGGNTKKAKKRKLDLPSDPNNYDWKKLAENDELKSIKVKDLKIYLSSNGLKMSGKKADLIERIKDHMDL